MTQTATIEQEMKSYTVRQIISQFGHKMAMPVTINFYYVESAEVALQKAVEQSGLDASLLEVSENEVVPTTKNRKASKPVKEVQTLYRVTFKDPSRAGVVVYVVLSSDGETRYHTTLVNGRATGCSCPAYKPCYHMSQLEAREQERAQREAEMAEATAVAPAILGEQFSQDPEQHIEDELSDPYAAERAAWRKMTKEQRRARYTEVFGIYDDVA